VARTLRKDGTRLTDGLDDVDPGQLLLVDQLDEGFGVGFAADGLELPLAVPVDLL
jgi:hypothetical protein